MTPREIERCLAEANAPVHPTLMRAFERGFLLCSPDRARQLRYARCEPRIGVDLEGLLTRLAEADGGEGRVALRNRAISMVEVSDDLGECLMQGAISHAALKAAATYYISVVTSKAPGVQTGRVVLVHKDSGTVQRHLGRLTPEQMERLEASALAAVREACGRPVEQHTSGEEECSGGPSPG